MNENAARMDRCKGCDHYHIGRCFHLMSVVWVSKDHGERPLASDVATCPLSKETKDVDE